MSHCQPAPVPGLRSAYTSHALLCAGCSSTPPQRFTASSAAMKQPPSSPSLYWCGLRVLPCQNRPQRWQGGCATTGCGPAYLRASRASSHGSTFSRPEYTPDVSTYNAAIILSSSFKISSPRAQCFRTIACRAEHGVACSTKKAAHSVADVAVIYVKTTCVFHARVFGQANGAPSPLFRQHPLVTLW